MTEYDFKIEPLQFYQTFHDAKNENTSDWSWSAPMVLISALHYDMRFDLIRNFYSQYNNFDSVHAFVSSPLARKYQEIFSNANFIDSEQELIPILKTIITKQKEMMAREDFDQQTKNQLFLIDVPNFSFGFDKDEIIKLYELLCTCRNHQITIYFGMSDDQMFDNELLTACDAFVSNNTASEFILDNRHRKIYSMFPTLQSLKSAFEEHQVLAVLKQNMQRAFSIPQIKKTVQTNTSDDNAMQQQHKIKLSHFSFGEYLQKQNNHSPFILFRGFHRTGRTTHLQGILNELGAKFNDAVVFKCQESPDQMAAPQFWRNCQIHHLRELSMEILNNFTKRSAEIMKSSVSYKQLVVIEDIQMSDNTRSLVTSNDFIEWLIEARKKRITVIISCQYHNLCVLIEHLADIIFQNSERSLVTLKKLYQFPFHEFPGNKFEIFAKAVKFYCQNFGALVAIRNQDNYRYMYHVTDWNVLKNRELELK